MKPASLWHAVRALRPKQWTKNAVVFAAFAFALGDRQQNLDVAAFWTVLYAAIAFCMVSSGVYLFNDVRDIEQDRAHPNKKLRPIAAGELPVPTALGMAAVLLAAGLALSWKLSLSLFYVVAGYVVLQVVYTLALKRVALVDLFVIAAGFVLRALAGGVVLEGVRISPWLLLCTLLLALFLALCKRRHEKVVLSDYGTDIRESLAKYDQQLLDQLIAIVSAATIVSYSLYTLWPDTVDKFETTRLAFTIPFVIFGIFRYLDLVYRHEKGGQPEQILLTDIPLLVDLVLYGLTVFLVLGRSLPF
ncbi:MAG: Decaprenyl-phosphate phosphoribosyltransferase [Verrucomicrobia bacterium ADurb.Bin345]|nr:MAG: Decaprenyl-phosphate phosphoribosyltransferase [Verrucomicrobia bacterium ADurb.Bin345]